MALYHKKYSFSVLFEGITIGNFKTVGPLEATFEVMEEAEGGSLTNTKELGRVSYTNITCTRGVTVNRTIHDLFKGYITGVFDDPIPLTILQKDRKGSVIASYLIEESKPVRYKAGEWDATSSEALIEELEIAHQGFERLV